MGYVNNVNGVGVNVNTPTPRLTCTNTPNVDVVDVVDVNVKKYPHVCVRARACARTCAKPRWEITATTSTHVNIGAFPQVRGMLTCRSNVNKGSKSNVNHVNHVNASKSKVVRSYA